MAALLEKFIFGRQYLALELFTLSQVEYIAMLAVERKKNELVISQQELFESKEDYTKYKSKLPAALIINNGNVLHKEVHGHEAVDARLLHKAFSGLKVDEFYYEIWRHGEIAVVSVCRKNYVDETIARLEENFNIASVSLGVNSISALSGFEYPPVLTTNTQRIDLEASENIISSFDAPQHDYTINGLNIPSSHLLAFCGTLKFIIPSVTTGSIVDIGIILYDKFRQKTFFDRGLKTGIGILLGLLLINFLVFSYYFDTAVAMTETVSMHKIDISNITKIRQRIKDQEQRLQNFTSSIASASSLVINDLVKNLPSAILLSELSFHPLEKKIKEGEPVVTTDSQILISGATLSNSAFTQWVQDIEHSKWVDKVTINSFGTNSVNSTVFSITIVLKK